MSIFGKQAFKALLLGLTTLLLPVGAQAAEGFATANVNMRSGPSTGYPAVTVIPVGTPVEIHGCLADIPWCDVSFYDGRGWVAGRYVQANYQSRRVYVEPDYYGALGVPLVTFEVDRYWDRHYRNRNFYRDRDSYRRNPNYYRRDTDNNRNNIDRRIRRDYQEFDRNRRNREDGIIIEGPRRDRARIERRREYDQNFRNDRDGRRDRDRDMNRNDNRRDFDRDNNRDRSERRNRDGDRQREFRRDNGENQSRGDRNERRRDRGCMPGEAGCN
ncbi:SH3 domain-containing protein [Pararhizobium gei]|uniref:SH3 domain-containing protein n=1 Tax=Pararhizobium gei TaxID=1395951 RepID=UPI0023DCB4BA|nr:SH3 domain-containing protein [Rhizobium gei]